MAGCSGQARACTPERVSDIVGWSRRLAETGASVYSPVMRQGTSTNEMGFFNLELPRGKHVINFSYVGYKSQSREFYMTGFTSIQAELELQDSFKVVVIATALRFLSTIEKWVVSKLSIDATSPALIS